MLKILGNHIEAGAIIAISDNGTSEIRECKDKNTYMDVLFKGGGQIRFWGYHDEIEAARAKILDAIEGGNARQLLRQSEEKKTL